MSQTRIFIFIGGAEGSGTTVLLRLLSAPDGCASLGGNFQKLPNHPEAKQLADTFMAANSRVWDRKLSFDDHEKGRRDWRAAMDKIMASPAFAETTRFIFKRSFPFSNPREQFTPDMWEILTLIPDCKILLIYRDPKSATYSALRRQFDSDLRRLAVVCNEQLTWLAGQARAIGPERVRIISYERLCADPVSVVEPIADFCNIPFAQVNEAIRREGMHANPDARWTHELSPQDSNWLTQFFDDRRLRQWEILEASCH
jgi:hypothetical protein